MAVVGLAFYIWDYGVKHGGIQVLGAASYLAPLLSTRALILAGYATFNLNVAAACLLIMGGAILASKEFLAQGRTDLFDFNNRRVTINEKGNSGSYLFAIRC